MTRAAMEPAKQNRPRYYVHTFSWSLKGAREAFITVEASGTLDGGALYFGGRKYRIHSGQGGPRGTTTPDYIVCGDRPFYVQKITTTTQGEPTQ